MISYDMNIRGQVSFYGLCALDWVSREPFRDLINIIQKDTEGFSKLAPKLAPKVKWRFYGVKTRREGRSKRLGARCRFWAQF
jgi:hypothetical protein